MTFSLNFRSDLIPEGASLYSGVAEPSALHAGERSQSKAGTERAPDRDINKGELNGLKAIRPARHDNG